MEDVRNDFDAQVQETLRSNIRRIAEERFDTLAAAARAAGIPGGTFRPTVTGSNNVTLKIITRCASAWDVPIAEFFGAPSPPLPSVHLMKEDGVIDSNGEAPLVVQARANMPDLDVRAGDLLFLSYDAGYDVGGLVLVAERGRRQIHRVRSDSPLVLERSGAPAVVFDDRYQEIVAVVVELRRRIPTRS